jgi:hypothetical protein
MSDDLTWKFVVALIERLIFPGLLVILAVTRAVVTHQSLKAFRK